MFFASRAKSSGLFYHVFRVYYSSDTRGIFYLAFSAMSHDRDATRDTLDRRIGFRGRHLRVRGGGGRGNPLTMEISPFPGVAFCMRRAGKARESRYLDIDNYRLANTRPFSLSLYLSLSSSRL